jgi:glycosyltransferase involved in cell wall biosynthesis
VRVAWLVYGSIVQPTGGYIYDRLVIEGLRARGVEVDVLDPATAPPGAYETADVLVGDALCVRELGGIFERAATAPVPRPARVLLVHHLPSWEIERTDREALRAVEARALSESDRVVSTSHATRDRLLEEGATAAIEVVVPGADRLARATPVPRDPALSRGVQLLFVGSLVARKRLPWLLDAIETLPEPRPSLLCLGDVDREPDHARSVLARIEASPVLRGRVVVAGVVDDATLARAMADADLLVLPSSLEGYGMVVTEALHAGLPVLVAAQPARAAGVASLGGVLVFGEDTGHRLAAMLGSFVADPATRDAVRQAAGALRLPRWDDAIESFFRLLVLSARP